jgi:phospholipid transport system transporter-binding protein
MPATTFALPATVTVFEAAGVLVRLDQALAAVAAGGALQIDARALTRFDSSALALLLQARRQASAQGRRVAFDGLPPRLSELARLYGVGELVV